MLDDFDKLKNKVYLCFSHNTVVPGLSDYIKHLDAFSNLCFELDVGFLVGKSPNISRSVVDSADIVNGVGLIDVIESLSSKTINSLVVKQEILDIDLNFNIVASGYESAIIGHRITHSWSYPDRINFFKSQIVNEILSFFSKKYNKKFISVDDLISQSNFTFDSIKLNFNVKGMSLILKFLRNNSEFYKALKNISKNKLFSGNDSVDDTLNVVFHIRRGDISVFKFQDKFIACWGDYNRPIENASHPQVISRIEDSIYNYYHIDPYISLLKKIASVSNKKLNLCFLCDGFDRGIQRITQYANLTGDELDNIKYQAELKKDIYITKVKELSNDGFDKIEIYFGETGELFFKSLDAIAKSNIFLYSAGGFGSTMFKYYNVHDNSIILGPCLNNSHDKDMLLLSKYL